MKKVMYVVHRAEIKRVIMVKQTPKGFMSESGRFYAREKLFSPSEDVDKTYKTQYVVGTLQKAISIANEQYHGQKQKLYYAHDAMWRKSITLDGERRFDMVIEQ